MDMPKFVKYTCIGDGDGAGIKYGDVLKVLTCGRFNPTYLYVETPFQSKYCGSSAMNKNKLKGKKFTYLAGYEYEIVKEEEKVESKHKFKVGDIVRGNDDRYAYTNSDMAKGRVVNVNSHTGFIDIKVLKHKWYSGNTTFTDLDYRDFDLVESKSAVVPQIPTSDTLYHITTDMKTFVGVEHNGNKGWSKCDVRYDKFDIHTGINLALERLDEVENPPVPESVKKLPKYVKYIGASGDGGLNNGDICRVLSGVTKGTTMYDDTLFVACPNPTKYNDVNASNPSALKGVNFTYLWPTKYEPVDFNIHE